MLKLNYITVIQVVSTTPLCFILTKIIIMVAKKINFVNYPNPIVASHQEATPYGGGLAIGATLFIYLLLQSFHTQIASKFILILVPVLMIGLFDDILKFSPLKKILLQVISAVPFLFYYINSSILLSSIFLLFILFSQNAWNLIDIMDGITAGISFIVFLSAGIILLPHNELELYSDLSFATALSVLGFRFLNRHPAKIFLGETGSLLLGSLFAFIVINTFLINELLAFFLLLLGIIPYFELFFLIIIRTRNGIPFYKGSPDHFALRMLNNGFSINKINFTVILICIIYSCLIVFVSLFEISKFVLIGCLSLYFFCLLIAFLYFQSLPAREIKR